MASGKLTARKVETAKPGRYSDGGGLWLVVSKTLAKKWVYRFTISGKVSETGLGGYPTVSLTEARELAAEARKLSSAGVSPVVAKREAKAAAIKAIKPPFGKIADDLIAAKSSEWRNDKHKAQWQTTLKKYCTPIWSKPVDEIETADVLAILTPLWKRTPETASRLRGRIEAVLNAAKVQGYRTGENPAAWRGHLAHIFPKREKISLRRHHTAMAYEEIPALIARLSQEKTMAARALEIAILTASRTGEVLGAKWAEINLQTKVWEIPARRMKAGVLHRVPLSESVIQHLEKLKVVRVDDFVFPGKKAKRPLANNSMLVLLRAIGIEPEKATVHGFRSTFRDWCGNETHFPREIAEAAIAHTIQGVEAAYRRSDALEKRRALMQAWAQYCEPKDTDNVLKFQKSSA
ncbi:MAG: site-specific integrase [Methylocystaceae bacterium]|jgi:integrase|nr:site-specific integrase [Methylocystaceae bacterium]